MRRVLFVLVQCSWGLIQTALGAAVLLRYRSCPRFRYHGAVVTVCPRSSSLSLGLFVFLADHPPRDRSGLVPDGEISSRLLVHEYGHTVQSLLLGPLYLPLAGLPSALWASLPLCQRKWRGKISYFSFYTEKSANFLGEWATGERSIGPAVI